MLRPVLKDSLKALSPPEPLGQGGPTGFRPGSLKGAPGIQEPGRKDGLVAELPGDSI
ncbi:hypothetical protein NicSoilC12_29690 [Arthrobacter sp. NicSoilC12]|nr:hypothetical protein NicSoilC12_29690 [Arthrobacter sp. NicSoilC12]